MIVKFFKKPPGGGGAGSVKYLLNDRVENETARVLQGDPQLTTSIINSINRNDKATIGCMSFEEQNIDESLKYKLMNDLEKTLFPGMDKSQYNILWVEHIDKDRLELNFVIPKQELTTNKLLTPYYHKQDLPRLETFEKLNNLQYNFTNPLDPAKSRNIQEANTKEQKLYKSYEELDLHLKQKVKSGELTNRDDLISYVKELGHEVTRTSDKGISIKMEDSKKARRFKDDMYSSKFKNLESINIMKVERAQASQEFNQDLQQNKDEKIQEYSEKLEELNSYKALILADKYSPSLSKEPKIIIEKAKEQTNEIVSPTVTIKATNKQDEQRKLEDERRRIRDRNIELQKQRSDTLRNFRDRIQQQAERDNNKRKKDYEESIENNLKKRTNHIEQIEQKVQSETATFRDRIHKTVSRIKSQFKTFADKVKNLFVAKKEEAIELEQNKKVISQMLLAREEQVKSGILEQSKTVDSIVSRITKDGIPDDLELTTKYISEMNNEISRHNELVDYELVR